LPFSGELKNVHQVILEHTGPVAASLIAGQWALAPGHSLDAEPATLP
jgi:hypothetical protein